MTRHRIRRTKLQQFKTASIEIGFILFLFYANLLMGEFTRSTRVKHTVVFALRDVITPENLAIGIVAACLGHGIFEYLRRRL
jgi:hypothetical protein